MYYEVIIPDQAQISGPLKAYRFRISDFGMRSTWTLEKMKQLPSFRRARVRVIGLWDIRRSEVWLI